MDKSSAKRNLQSLRIYMKKYSAIYLAKLRKFSAITLIFDFLVAC